MDFHGSNWSIPGFYENRLNNIYPYSPLKPTKVGFIFIGPNFLSRAEDHAALNHVTSCRQSWVEDWVLMSGLRNYNSSQKNLNRGL